MNRPGPSSSRGPPSPEEDWTQVSDLTERRRMQNRIAQRNYRRKLKQRAEAEEQRRQTGLQVGSAPSDPMESPYQASPLDWTQDQRNLQTVPSTTMMSNLDARQGPLLLAPTSNEMAMWTPQYVTTPTQMGIYNLPDQRLSPSLAYHQHHYETFDPMPTMTSAQSTYQIDPPIIPTTIQQVPYQYTLQSQPSIRVNEQELEEDEDVEDEDEDEDERAVQTSHSGSRNPNRSRVAGRGRPSYPAATDGWYDVYR